MKFSLKEILGIILFLSALHASNAVAVEGDRSFKDSTWMESLESYTETRDWTSLRNSFRKVVIIPERTESKTWKREGRNEKLLALLSLYQSVAHVIDLNFDLNDKPDMLVVPPRGSGVKRGADPSEIEDEELRKKYESMLALNEIKKSRLSFELRSRDTMKEILSYIQSYVARHYSGDDENLLNSLVEKKMGISYGDLMSGTYLNLVRKQDF